MSLFTNASNAGCFTRRSSLTSYTGGAISRSVRRSPKKHVKHIIRVAPDAAATIGLCRGTFIDLDWDVEGDVKTLTITKSARGFRAQRPCTKGTDGKSTGTADVTKPVTIHVPAKMNPDGGVAWEAPFGEESISLPHFATSDGQTSLILSTVAVSKGETATSKKSKK